MVAAAMPRWQRLETHVLLELSHIFRQVVSQAYTPET